MKIELNNIERSFLADKTFWEWKRAEIDLWSIPLLFSHNKKVAKKIREQERFYKKLYKKLMSGEDDE